MLTTNCNTTALANLTSALQNVARTLEATLRRLVFVPGSWVFVPGVGVRGFVGPVGAGYRPAHHPAASPARERMSCWAGFALAMRWMGSPSISPVSIGKCLDRRQLKGLNGDRPSELSSLSVSRG